MITYLRSALTLAAALGALLPLTACSEGAIAPSGLDADLDPSFAHGTHPRDADFNNQLAELRRAVAKFHRFDAAMAAGWDTQITPCLDNPPLGAQGFHYGNVSIIDGTVNLTEPELLLYEPRSNGLRFVGVEYIVPFDFVPSTATPPSLLGQDFSANMAFGLWALHVWVPRHNPSGMFAHWNPKVSC